MRGISFGEHVMTLEEAAVLYRVLHLKRSSETLTYYSKKKIN
jgi:hypothetical protein